MKFKNEAKKEEKRPWEPNMDNIKDCDMSAVNMMSADPKCPKNIKEDKNEKVEKEENEYKKGSFSGNCFQCGKKGHQTEQCYKLKK